MPQITKEEVEKIARLARLDLSPQEIDRYAKDLSAVLSYVSKLQELSDNVAITAQVTGLANVMRTDTALPCAHRAKLLEAAPSREGDGVKVKQVL